MTSMKPSVTTIRDLIKYWDDNPASSAQPASTGPDDPAESSPISPEVAEPPVVTDREPPAQSYAERSAYIDEIFQNLPLAHQLTLATLALENARTRLK